MQLVDRPHVVDAWKLRHATTRCSEVWSLQGSHGIVRAQEAHHAGKGREGDRGGGGRPRKVRLPRRGRATSLMRSTRGPVPQRATSDRRKIDRRRGRGGAIGIRCSITVRSGGVTVDQEWFSSRFFSAAIGVGCPHAPPSCANLHSARRSRRHRLPFPAGSFIETLLPSCPAKSVRGKA